MIVNQGIQQDYSKTGCCFMMWFVELQKKSGDWDYSFRANRLEARKKAELYRIEFFGEDWFVVEILSKQAFANKYYR
jgi:hypothetical protein